VPVSSSLHDVVAGSNIGFADHGTHQLKEISGEWRLFGVAAIDGVEREGVLDAAEAAKRRYAIEPTATPSNRRTPILVGAALGVVLIAGALAFVLSSGGDDPSNPAA